MISIIIPTYNEGSVIKKTLVRLSEISCKEGKEIIIADGGSEDNTLEIAKKYARVVRSGKGKAKQLNEGEKKAKGKRKGRGGTGEGGQTGEKENEQKGRRGAG